MEFGAGTRLSTVNIRRGLNESACGVARMNSWGLDSDAGAVWREWDGEVAVYVGARSSTHLLSPDASQIFLMLVDGPIDLSGEGQDRESEREFGDLGSNDRAFIERTLLEFGRLGLARPL